MSGRPPLQIPDQHLPAFMRILDLSHEDAARLIEAFRQAPLTARRDEFMSKIASVAQMSTEDVSEITELLLNLYWAPQDWQTSDAHSLLVSAIVEAMQRLVPGDKDWAAFRDRLERLLSLDRSVGLVAKAITLWNQQEHVLQSARVLTDIRPVFSDDPQAAPAAAMVAHTLVITYSEGGVIKQFYVAVDSSRLQDLRQTLDRAESKARSVANVLDTASVAQIDVGAR